MRGVAIGRVGRVRRRFAAACRFGQGRDQTRRAQRWQRLAAASSAPRATANRASGAFSPAGPPRARRSSGNCRWAPATACPRSAAAGCFSSIASCDRGPAASRSTAQHGQAAVDVRISHRFRGPVRLRQRPALLAGGRWRSRLPVRRRGNAALPERGRRQADLEGRHRGRFRRHSEFLRRRQQRRSSRATADRASRRQPARRARACPPGRLDQVEGNGSGIVAFDKLTGKVRYKITTSWPAMPARCWPRSTAAAGALCSPAAGWSASSRPTGRSISSFPGGRAILESVNASNPVVVGDRVFISETYGPGSALLRVKPGEAEVVWSDRKAAARQGDADALEHADSSSTAIYTARAAGTPRTPSCGAVELATGKVTWSEPGSDAIVACCTSTDILSA